MTITKAVSADDPSDSKIMIQLQMNIEPKKSNVPFNFKEKFYNKTP
jgi:hypothetical protein